MFLFPSGANAKEVKGEGNGRERGRKGEREMEVKLCK